jgi:CBS domain-containing protein
MGVAMNVAEILSAKGDRVATIPPDRPVVEAIELLRANGVGALVVSPDGRAIVGLLSERDIVRHIATDGALAVHEPVRALMTEKVLTCRTNDRTDELMARMTERRVRHLPVVDADGKLCGIISIGDVVKARVGELEDEQAQLVEYVRAGR